MVSKVRTILLLIVAAVIGLITPVQAQGNQNWRDPNSGVLFYNGPSSGPFGGGFFGGGGWGAPGTYNYNSSYTSRNPTLEKFFYVGGAVLTLHELLRYFKSDKVEVKETSGGLLVVNKTNGKVEFFPSYSQSTATHAVVQPRVEDWNGRDWGDPEIQEMKREARRLEEKADAIERYTDAQTRLEEARQYRKDHRQVAVAKPTNGGEKVKELKKIVPEPTLEEQGFILDPDDLDNPSPETEKAKPEGTFNWQPASPASSKVVLAGGFTPEENKFFGNNGNSLVVTETLAPPTPQKRKILQRDKKGDWVQAN